MRLFADRLDTVDPGFGIEAMVLQATESEPLTAEQTGFSASGTMDTATLAALIDRLQSRLGRDRVVRLMPVESHVPERAERRVKAGGKERGVKSLSSSPPPLRGRSVTALRDREGGSAKRLSKWQPTELSLEKSRRPLTLLPIPEPIQAIAPVPDDPPLSFRWKDTLHRVAAADGPERIGPEWWRADTARKPRDYYRVEDSEGRRFWLYREGLYGGEQPPLWFLHGFFP
jgi:protein ImuB